MILPSLYQLMQDHMFEFYTHATNSKNHIRCVIRIDCTATNGSTTDIICDNDNDNDNEE